MAIQSLRNACGAPGKNSATLEPPEGVVYCGGGGIQRQIEYVISDDTQDQWNASVTVNGEQIRAMTAYSFFGNFEPPKGFVVALLGEDRSGFLVFRNRNEDWIELGDYRYDKCN